MDRIQQYRAAAFGEMIISRARNHILERLLCAIDNNEPCRDLGSAVNLLQVAFLDARRATEDAFEGLSSVEIMEAASPARIGELCNELSAHVDVDTNTVIQDAVNVLRHYRENEKRIAELEAEVAELKADKARLDWLSEKAHMGCVGLDSDTESCDGIAVYECGWFEDYRSLSEGETLRAAIDAAMTK